MDSFLLRKYFSVLLNQNSFFVLSLYIIFYEAVLITSELMQWLIFSQVNIANYWYWYSVKKSFPKYYFVIFVFSLLNSSVIRQRGNLKTMLTRKQITQIFPKPNISYPLIPTCWRVRNVSFWKILHALFFCKHLFEIHTFALWPTNCILEKLQNFILKTWKILEFG